MTPVVIPSAGGDCLAYYHEASGPAVLICPPFGDEALKTARIWRDLAVRLQSVGIAALRFDLPGTGNSGGAPDDPDRVPAWRDAVRACAEWLERRQGRGVILFGHRFGALLALDAAAATVAAERLILLDPPVSGATLARYLRARSRFEYPGPVPAGPDYIQAGGVPLARETLAALPSLPAPIPGNNFPPTLLVLDETAVPNPWPQILREHGSEVETIPFAGHADFVPHDAFRATAPSAVLDHVVARLARLVDPARPPAHHRWPAPARLRAGGATEMPIRFGPDGELFGILCRPAHSDPARPAILLPSTGADPCAGMSRLWTELARRLARHGVTSLRFDMRGVGESGGDLGPDRLAGIYHPDRVADVRAAVDALVELGFADIRIVSYCAGAYAAWHAARVDPRIAAILAGNLLYLSLQPTLAQDVLSARPGASLIGITDRPIGRLLSTERLAALRRLDDGARRLVPRRVRHVMRRWGNDPTNTRRHLRALVARGCTVALVMAQDDHGHVRLRRAFGEDPRLPPGVELTVIGGADHQFSDPWHRARFLDLATEFATRPSPDRPATEAPSPAPRQLERV